MHAVRFHIFLFILLLLRSASVAVETNNYYDLLFSYARQINSQIDSVYLNSTVRLSSLDPSKPLFGGTDLEFWGNGVNYRYQSRMPFANKEMEFDITFNGTNYGIRNVKGKTLNVSTNDSAILPISYNPLFLPVAFLSPEDDSCQGCQLKLADFLRIEELINKIKILESRENAERIEIVLAGGVINQEKFNWRLTYSVTNRLLPLNIRREAIHGDVINEIVFPESIIIELNGQTTIWPKKIEYMGFDGQPKQKYKLTFNLNALSFAPLNNPEMFLPVTNDAQIIFDGDVDGRILFKTGAARIIDPSKRRNWILFFMLLSGCLLIGFIMKGSNRRTNPL